MREGSFRPISSGLGKGFAFPAGKVRLIENSLSYGFQEIAQDNPSLAGSPGVTALR